MCLVCLDKIGDEFHFLLECPRHQSLRSRLIGRYYWNRPSMLKSQQLLNSTCTKVIRAVAKFVYKAFNDLWFYAIHVCGFCMCWYPVAIPCYCVRHADQMFLSRRTFVRARGPKTIIKSLNLNLEDLLPLPAKIKETRWFWCSYRPSPIILATHGTERTNWVTPPKSASLSNTTKYLFSLSLHVLNLTMSNMCWALWLESAKNYPLQTWCWSNLLSRQLLKLGDTGRAAHWLLRAL